MMIREEMFRRLTNWRRVYGDNAAPAVSITPHDMLTGDYYALISSTRNGFFIQFYNSGGSGVARRFDYTARGYGQSA